MIDDTSRFPVVIVGAGPAGLMVANLLATLGVAVLVLERNAATVDQPRAIVLDDEGMRTLQAAGLHEHMMPFVLPGVGAAYYDDLGTPFAETGAGIETYGFAKRFLIDQPDLERVLADGLGRFGQAELRFDTRVVSIAPDADHVDILLDDGSRVRADWLLACDGARSGTRDQLGIAMEGFAYPDRWLVIDTANDPDTSRASKFVCRLDRPYVSIAAPRGGRRYEFKLLPDEDPERICAFDEVRERLAPIRDLAAADLRRAAVYGFRASLAERWSSGRVLLLGDAAHLTPPFAGQGMNAGLRDAANVAWKIALVERGIADPGLLASYEAERRDAAAAMIQLAVTMGEIVMPTSETDKTLRAALLAKLSAFPGLRTYLMEMRFKPPPRIADEHFIGVTAPSVPASLIGAIIPQPHVRRGGMDCRLDDVIGPGFAILMQSRDIAEWAAAQPADAWHGLDPKLVLIEAGEGAPIAGVEAIGGLDHPMAFGLLAHRDHALLVRPDRYAAAFFTPATARDTLALFAGKLGQRPAADGSAAAPGLGEGG